MLLPNGRARNMMLESLKDLCRLKTQLEERDCGWQDSLMLLPNGRARKMMLESLKDLCRLKTQLEERDCGWLLGDSGYPLKKYLITLKTNANRQEEISFNLAHSQTRIGSTTRPPRPLSAIKDKQIEINSKTVSGYYHSKGVYKMGLLFSHWLVWLALVEAIIQIKLSSNYGFFSMEQKCTQLSKNGKQPLDLNCLCSSVDCTHIIIAILTVIPLCSHLKTNISGVDIGKLAIGTGSNRKALTPLDLPRRNLFLFSFKTNRFKSSLYFSLYLLHELF